MNLNAVLLSPFVIGSSLMGWCSYDKMKSFIVEYGRYGNSKEVNEYNGKRLITLDEANAIIGNAIESGKPFMAGRLGSVEMGALWKVRDNGKGFICPVKKSLKVLCNNAGFFPEDKKLMIKFASLMKEAAHQVNIIGVWSRPMEEWMLRTYGNNPIYCHFSSITPLFSSCAWTKKLAGKKVLVIHPFEKTIQAQYRKRELLFPDTNILPEFELMTLKAVQTIAGNKDERFATWFDALDYMYTEAMKKDFDIAILGCGAYGFPLAAKLKQAGKISIHLGGNTQILFGIKGKRWENEETYADMMNNPAWVYPAEDETPKGFKTVENGCYW